MARVELVMPKMGESIMEATIIRWTKQIGQPVAAEETLLEIATDKVDSEVPSPAAGVLAEVLFKENDVVAVGQVIAVIETAPVAASPTPAAPKPVQQPTPVVQPAVAEAMQVAAGPELTLTAQVLAEPARGRFYSPLVLNIAREEGIAPDELDRIPGTGSEGRVTKKDILTYVQTRKAAPVAAPAPVATPEHMGANGLKTAVAEAPRPAVIEVPLAPPPIINVAPPPVIEVAPPVVPQAPAPVVAEAPAPVSEPAKVAPAPEAPRAVSISGEYDIVEMDRMRRIIAQNMVQSMHTSPHVQSFVEADVTPVVQWRERNKAAFEKKYGQRLTFTPFFIWAVAKALRDYPMVNIAVDGDRILVRKEINVGMAAALPTGNLIVPVIKHADRLNLAGLAEVVNGLTDKARNNKLKLDDLEGGTYTVSNVGNFGSVMGTPIILQPQCAILAVGAIRKKPAVLELPEGDVIAIRHLMFLSHSYDHRVIDGMLGGQFVKRVADYLEGWDADTEV